MGPSRLLTKQVKQDRLAIFATETTAYAHYCLWLRTMPLYAASKSRTAEDLERIGTHYYYYYLYGTLLELSLLPDQYKKIAESAKSKFSHTTRQLHPLTSFHESKAQHPPIYTLSVQ